MIVEIGGRKITRVTWRPDDDNVIRGAIIIGRVHVRIAGKYEVDALLVASGNPRNLGERFAVFFDPFNPTSGRIVALDVPREVP